MSTPRYMKEWRLRTAREGLLLVDAEPFRQLVAQWVADGYTCGQIAAASGYSEEGVGQLLHGKRAQIRPDSAAKLAATRMHPGLIPDYLTIDATGSRRRMQALIAIGHTAIAIARELRVSREFVSNLLAGRYPTIRRRYATAVAELYRQWSTIPGPSKRSRTTAAQRGFHGPLAWGDDIDDPAAVPETDVTEAELNRDELAAERVTEMWLLASAGQQPEQIARRLGMSANQVRNRLSTLFPHLYLELTA